MDGFLAISQRFKLNGLMKNDTDGLTETTKNYSSSTDEYKEEVHSDSETVANPMSPNPGSLSSQPAYIERLSNGNYKCAICGKLSNRLYNLKRHVEMHEKLVLSLF